MKNAIFTIEMDLRKIKTVFVLFISGIFIVYCSPNDDGFEGANGDVAKKYVTKVTVSGDGDSFTGTIEYDNNGKVISASNGSDIKHFIYGSNGKLDKISGGGDNILTSEVMSEIYDAYKVGDVLHFDDNGNPTLIELYDEDYYGDQIVHTAAISYDDKPFMYYYTLNAAGIIDVLYDVRFRFIAPEEIVLAKKLLPVNNPIKAVITNQYNNEVETITVSYDYGSDNYPISSYVRVEDSGYVKQYNANYKYK